MDKVTAHILAVLVLLSSISVIIYLHDFNKTYTVRQRIILGELKPGYTSLKLSASYHIVVKDSNGNVKAERTKLNDPISIQWYRLVADMMFGFIRNGTVSWTDTGATTRGWIDTEYEGINPKAYIGLGSGTGTPSRNDYKLFNEVTKDVASMSVTDDTVNSQYIVTYTKSFTIASAFTLTEVGLLLYVDVDTGSGTIGTYLLVTHDSVSPSVDLVSGDSVTVTYTITIPYNTNGAFTRWFYNALINYFLGYKGTTGNALTLKTESNNNGGIDTAYDSYNSGDCVNGEYTYIEIGNSSSSVNPLFETYSLGSRIQRMRIDNPQFVNKINETSYYTIQYIASFSFTSSASISEIGVSYYTDYITNYECNGAYYLWMYWVLANPINVDAGDGLRVEITIEIPYT